MHAYDQVEWDDTAMYSSLTEINDAIGFGFDRIALLIELHPEWLFHEDIA